MYRRCAQRGIDAGQKKYVVRPYVRAERVGIDAAGSDSLFDFFDGLGFDLRIRSAVRPYKPASFAKVAGRLDR